MTDAPLWLQLLVVTLGAARLTALVAGDRIARPVRWRILARHPKEDFPGALFDCPWCAGWWWSLACVLAWWRWPIGTSWVLLPWAVAFVIGALGRLMPDDDPEQQKPKPPAPQRGDVY